MAGHGRLAAAQMIYEDLGGVIYLPGGQRLPNGMVPTLDCSGWSAEQRQAYVIADNRLAEVATWDEAMLKAELASLEQAGGLDFGALGFTEAALARALAGPETASAAEVAAREWRGMPEFSQKDTTAFRSMPVHFKDQAAVDAFAKLIGQKITANTRFIWFPEVEVETYADKRYVASDGRPKS